MKHIRLFKSFQELYEAAGLINPVNPTNTEDELLDAIEKAWEKYDAQFDNWAFDERDYAEDVDFYIEKALKRKLTPADKKTEIYKDVQEQADELADAAAAIGYQGRIGTKVSQAEAEEKYQSLKGSSFNGS
jgi:hypothetical protein